MLAACDVRQRSSTSQSSSARWCGWRSSRWCRPYSDRFGLTKLDAGLLLASASLTILVSSIPATVLSDRYGARRVTLVAVAVMALSDVGQGAANSFWMLLAARMLFGIAFGTLWVSGVAWLAEEAGSRQARALSLTITTAGLGGIVGPAFAGVLVQRFGLAAPYTVCAVITAGIVPAMLAAGSRGGGRAESAPPLLSTLAAAMRSRLILASLLLMGLGGMVGGAVNLLVPLQLHRNGLTSAGIGLAFSAAAVAFIASSAGVARLGERAARIEVGHGERAHDRRGACDCGGQPVDAGGAGLPAPARADLGADVHDHVPARGGGGARGRCQPERGGGAPEHDVGGVGAGRAVLAGFATELTSERTTYVLVIVLALASAATMASARRSDAAEARARRVR